MMVHASEMAATTQGSGWLSLVSVIRRPLRARSHARWGSRDRLGSRSVIRRQLVVVSDRR